LTFTIHLVCFAPAIWDADFHPQVILLTSDQQFRMPFSRHNASRFLPSNISGCISRTSTHPVSCRPAFQDAYPAPKRILFLPDQHFRMHIPHQNASCFYPTNISGYISRTSTYPVSSRPAIQDPSPTVPGLLRNGIRINCVITFRYSTISRIKHL